VLSCDLLLNVQIIGLNSEPFIKLPYMRTVMVCSLSRLWVSSCLFRSYHKWNDLSHGLWVYMSNVPVRFQPN